MFLYTYTCVSRCIIIVDWSVKVDFTKKNDIIIIMRENLEQKMY